MEKNNLEKVLLMEIMSHILAIEAALVREKHIDGECWADTLEKTREIFKKSLLEAFGKE